MDRLNTSHGEQWTHSFLEGQPRRIARSSNVQLNGTGNYLETELGDVLNHDYRVMQDKKERGAMTRLLQVLLTQTVEHSSCLHSRMITRNNQDERNNRRNSSSSVLLFSVLDGSVC